MQRIKAYQTADVNAGRANRQGRLDVALPELRARDASLVGKTAKRGDPLNPPAPAGNLPPTPNIVFDATPANPVGLFGVAAGDMLEVGFLTTGILATDYVGATSFLLHLRAAPRDNGTVRILTEGWSDSTAAAVADVNSFTLVRASDNSLSLDVYNIGTSVQESIPVLPAGGAGTASFNTTGGPKGDGVRDIIVSRCLGGRTQVVVDGQLLRDVAANGGTSVLFKMRTVAVGGSYLQAPNLNFQSFLLSAFPGTLWNANDKAVRDVLTTPGGQREYTEAIALLKPQVCFGGGQQLADLNVTNPVNRGSLVKSGAVRDVKRAGILT